MPPRSEKFKSRKETKELTPRESLKEQFSKIISVHVDADNVDSFLEKALNQLILYTHAVTLAYKEESQSKDDSITKKLEDTALAHYGLPAIEEYFEGIEKRQKIIVEAQAFIDALVSEETIITPPDRGGSIRAGNGHGTFENPATQKRLMLLLYLLKVDFDITLSHTDIQKGVVTRNMVRSESYIAVSVKEKDRIIYVCDEIGNATYIFDTKKLEEINLTIEQLNNLTKDEKNTLIAENSGIGIRIVYSKFYRENITNLLEDAIPSLEAFKTATQSKPELQKETSDIPQVITDELHPWRGFLEWKNEKGVVEHLGSIGVIASRLKTNSPTIKNKFSIEVLSSMKGKDVRNIEISLYSFEQVQAKLKDYLALPQVNKNGEWKGFLERKNEEDVVEHFGPIKKIVQKMNLSQDKIQSSVKDLLTLKGKDLTNKEVNLYSFEQVQTKLKDYLALSQVSLEGGWKGFLEHTDIETGIVEHFCAIETISQKMDLNRYKIESLVKDLLTLKGKDLNSKEVNLYSFEQVQSKLKDYLNLPQVSLEGEWKGFLERVNEDTHAVEHYGPIKAIARRMKLSQGKIESSVNGFSSMKGRSTTNRELNLYSFEQVQSKLKDYLNLPQVSLEGEWKGFLERVNEDTHAVEHYGAVGTIVQKMNVSREKIESSVKDLLTLQGKDMSNIEVSLYSFEQVAKKLGK